MVPISVKPSAFAGIAVPRWLVAVHPAADYVHVQDSDLRVLTIVALKSSKARQPEQPACTIVVVPWGNTD